MHSFVYMKFKLAIAGLKPGLNSERTHINVEFMIVITYFRFLLIFKVKLINKTNSTSIIAIVKQLLCAK